MNNEPVKSFNLFEDDIKNINNWDKEHNNGKCYNMYYGAIGGRLTYSFLPTSIGEIIEIICDNCKEKLEIYDHMD